MTKVIKIMCAKTLDDYLSPLGSGDLSFDQDLKKRKHLQLHLEGDMLGSGKLVLASTTQDLGEMPLQLPHC